MLLSIYPLYLLFIVAYWNERLRANANGFIIYTFYIQVFNNRRIVTIFTYILIYSMYYSFPEARLIFIHLNSITNAIKAFLLHCILLLFFFVPFWRAPCSMPWYQTNTNETNWTESSWCCWELFFFSTTTSEWDTNTYTRRESESDILADTLCFLNFAFYYKLPFI